MQKLFLLLGIFSLTMFSILTSCNNHEKQRGISPRQLPSDTLTVNDPQIMGKLTISTVESRPFSRSLSAAGSVAAIPTSFAEIASPFKGRVTRTYLKLGMATTIETPLFEITSPDFIAAQKIFFQEKAQLELAQKNLQRQSDLVAHGVGVQKEFEEAQTAFDVERKEYENALAGIKIFKADPSTLILGQPLIVRSPIKGEVISNKVVLGQFLNDDAASIATVADLSTIWIVAQVKEKDIRYIHNLDHCTISIPALPEKTIAGKVFHINDIVNDNTRSIEVLVQADNRDHTLKPGMYATVDFRFAPENALIIPAKAILQQNENSYIYVETTPGRYIRRIVVTEDAGNGKIHVLTGLQPGEKIIAEGGFYLNAAQ